LEINDDTLEELSRYNIGLFLKISSDIMDAYTIAKMILSLKPNEKQILIYIGGQAHVENIIKFIDQGHQVTDVFDTKQEESVPQLNESIRLFKKVDEIPNQMPNRCLESDIFSDIFKSWIVPITKKTKKYGLKSEFIM
jgi:hypothetical protein